MLNLIQTQQEEYYDKEEQELIAAYQKLKELKRKFKKDEKHGFDLSPYKLFLNLRWMPSQLYSVRIQNYFIDLMGYEKLNAKQNKGDYINQELENIEFKCSLFEEEDEENVINVRQVRVWQTEIDFYHVLTISFSEDYSSITCKLYKLRKVEMEQELKLVGAKMMHNTREDVPSYGFSIKIGSEHYNRWEEKYLNKKFDINKIYQNKIKKNGGNNV